LSDLTTCFCCGNIKGDFKTTNNKTLPNLFETSQSLLARAEEKFGNQRAEELRSDIDQVAADLKELAAAKIEFNDEP
jgi:hypothetical protein